MRDGSISLIIEAKDARRFFTGFKAIIMTLFILAHDEIINGTTHYIMLRLPISR